MPAEAVPCQQGPGHASEAAQCHVSKDRAMSAFSRGRAMSAGAGPCRHRPVHGSMPTGAGPSQAVGMGWAMPTVVGSCQQELVGVPAQAGPCQQGLVHVNMGRGRRAMSTGAGPSCWLFRLLGGSSHASRSQSACSEIYVVPVDSAQAGQIRCEQPEMAIGGRAANQ